MSSPVPRLSGMDTEPNQHREGESEWSLSGLAISEPTPLPTRSKP
jgi:hypothetical protein